METGETRQLRSYIALGAPATRHPCDGTEAPLRVEYGFTPRWYHRRLGIDFSARWHLDPVYRHETLLRMRRELDHAFPGIVTGSGPLPEAIGRLEPPELSGTPVFVQLFEQMEMIERLFGRITGYLNWQGVLNTAYRLRGPEILADMLLNPGLAQHLFHVIADTMIAGMRFVYKRQEQAGVIVRHATVSNCLVNMVSPELYREQLLPWDRYIAAVFPAFGIHNCAWNVNPYIEDYATIKPLGYIDTGLLSDLVRVKRLCPEARRAVMYTPTDLANKNPEELRVDIRRIYRELAPCDIVMADIDAEVPDERVLEFDKIVRDTLEDAE